MPVEPLDCNYHQRMVEPPVLSGTYREFVATIDRILRHPGPELPDEVECRASARDRQVRKLVTDTDASVRDAHNEDNGEPDKNGLYPVPKEKCGRLDASKLIIHPILARVNGVVRNCPAVRLEFRRMLNLVQTDKRTKQCQQRRSMR